MAIEQMTDFLGKAAPVTTTSSTLTPTATITTGTGTKTTTSSSSNSSNNNLRKSDKEIVIIMPAEEKKFDDYNNDNNDNANNHINNNNNNNNDNSINNNNNNNDEVKAIAAREILKKFQTIINNEEGLNDGAEHLLNDLIDDAVFGVALEMHQLAKTGNLAAIEGIPENPEYPPTDPNFTASRTTSSNSIMAPSVSATSNSTTSYFNSTTNSSNSSVGTGLGVLSNRGAMAGAAGGGLVHGSSSTGESKSSVKVSSKYALKVDKPNHDIFGVKIAKKPMDCTCPNCDRLVSAARFAPHLEKCMGMGRLSSRIASRRLATKESNSNSSALSIPDALFGTNNVASLSKNYLHSHGTVATDEDDDDADWSSTAEKRRKKSHANSRNNGSKRNYSNQKF